MPHSREGLAYSLVVGLSFLSLSQLEKKSVPEVWVRRNEWDLRRVERIRFKLELKKVKNSLL
jgi:hypothetical protein